MKEIRLPDMGDGITAATVSMWYHKPGDDVKEGDDLVELVTDKATFNVPCSSAGKVSKIMFEEGDTVHPGDVLALIE
ncbi:MAG: hypothetical protein PHO42_02965 [Candidatus Omnitrophica bacterium]|nr:hypothetical protein [Candidatus Omnitrophota bacterium]